MQPLITAQQITKFAEFGWIEFEQFLSLSACEKILASVRQALTSRLKIKIDRLASYEEERVYAQGRDSFRENPELIPLLTRGALPSAASHLTHQRLLFLAFDQWIPKGHAFSPLQLQAHCSFQQLACGCLLILDGENAGNVRFFSPKRFPIAPDASQLLIAYATSTSVFVHNTADPLNSALKSFGYNFGDKIKPEHHPLCKI